MIPRRIERSTRTLGEPDGWDRGTYGPCVTLAVRDEARGALATMVSAWEPTPAEIYAIIAGAPVYLRVAGSQHPAVELTVGPVDRETPALSGANQR